MPEQQTPPGLEDDSRPNIARYGSWPVVIGVVAVALASSAVISVLLADVLGALDPRYRTDSLWGEGWFLSVLILINDLVLLSAVYVLLIRRGVTSWREMGVSGAFRGRSVVNGIGWGFVFIISSAAVSTLLARFGVVQDQAEQFPLDGAGALERLGIFAAGIVVVPFAEEVFFRGFVFRAMGARKGLWRGLLYSSVVFSAVHANLAALLPLAVGSMGLAYAYHRDKSLWTPIIAHAFNNTIALGILLLSTG